MSIPIQNFYFIEINDGDSWWFHKSKYFSTKPFFQYLKISPMTHLNVWMALLIWVPFPEIEICFLGFQTNTLHVRFPPNASIKTFYLLFVKCCWAVFHSGSDWNWMFFDKQLIKFNCNINRRLNRLSISFWWHKRIFHSTKSESDKDNIIDCGIYFNLELMEKLIKNIIKLGINFMMTKIFFYYFYLALTMEIICCIEQELLSSSLNKLFLLKHLKVITESIVTIFFFFISLVKL